MKSTGVPKNQLSMVIATYLFVPPEALVVWAQQDGDYTVSKSDDDIPTPLPDADPTTCDAEDLPRESVGGEIQLRADNRDAFVLAVKQGNDLYTVRTAKPD